MKKILAVFSLFFSSFLFSQTEQVSLNFFSESLFPKLKRMIVYYDGKLIDKTAYEKPKQGDDETVIEIILADYSITTHDRRGISNKNSAFANNFDYNEVIKLASIKNSTAKNLIIPKNLKFKKELKTKERKYGKLRFKINNFFSQKYNLLISPSIQIGENTYITRIFLNKQDYAKGNYFDIICNNGKVIDWVEIGWIQ